MVSRVRVDTAGPVLGINDFYIELTSMFPDLVFAVCSNARAVCSWCLLCTQKLSSRSDFKGTAANNVKQVTLSSVSPHKR